MRRQAVSEEPTQEQRKAIFDRDQKAKRKRDKNHIKEFINTIENDKQAYEIFRHEAEKSMMTWTSPLKAHQSSFRHKYFEQFILPDQEQQMREKKRWEDVTQVNKNSKEMGAKATAFIPLSDLLKRNHNDRVQYHLANLEGQAAETPGNNATANESPFNNRNSSTKENKQMSGNVTKVTQEIQMMQSKQGLATSLPQAPKSPTRSGKGQSMLAGSKKLQNTGQQVIGGTLMMASGKNSTLGFGELATKSLNKHVKVAKGDGSQTNKNIDSNMKSMSAQPIEKDGEKKKGGANVGAGGILSNQRDNIQFHDKDNKSQQDSGQSDDGGSVSSTNNQRASRRGNTRRTITGGQQLGSGFKLSKDKQGGQGLTSEQYIQLQAHFVRISGGSGGKLGPKDLQNFVSSIYPGQLGKNIYHALSSNFKGIQFTSQMGMPEHEFYRQLEIIFNPKDGEDGFKRFAFRIFDTNNDEKISEMDLQELMKSSSTQQRYYNNPDLKRNEPFVGLNDKPRDIFLDYFYPDYIKIIKEIERKKSVKGVLDDIRGTPKNKPQNVPHLGSRTSKPANQRTRNSSNISEASSDDTTQGSQRVTVKKKSQNPDNRNSSGLGLDKGSLESMMNSAGGLKGELQKKIDDRKEKLGFFITKEEFIDIHFDNEWPLIVKDIAYQLTGMDLLKSNRISEAEELGTNSFSPPDGHWFEDSKLNQWRSGKLTIRQYSHCLHVFRCLMGRENRIEDQKHLDEVMQAQALGTISENQIYLEEKDFVNNFDRVFGHPCPYFGKLLYLFLSEGFDRKKIHFLKFLEALYPVFDKDNQLNQNKIAFKILDMDRDDNLNIINLLDLQNNLSQKTPLGQEIFRLVHYQVTNLHDKSINKKRETLNYDVFCKVVGRSIMIEELRENIFGTWLESKDAGKTVKKELSYKKVSQPSTKSQKKEEEVFTRSPSIFLQEDHYDFTFDHYFKDVKLKDDCSFGQRNYERNLDALLTSLVKRKEKPAGKKKDDQQL